MSKAGSSDGASDNARPRTQFPSIEKWLGVSAYDPSLLELAFVHSSYLNENPGESTESNERLEFLGDALVDLVVGHELYRRFPGRQEGELTALRSALVRDDTLARIAESMKLGDRLLLGRGEDAGGGRQRPSNLAGVFEALVGAIFVDQGFQEAQRFVVRVMSDELSALDHGQPPKDPKSLLQELVQADGAAAPSYRIVGATGDDHARSFTAEVVVSGKVLGKGTGRRKSLAEFEAASEALASLDRGAHRE